MVRAETRRPLRVALVVLAFALLAAFLYVAVTSKRGDPRALALVVGSGLSLELAAFVDGARKNWSMMISIAAGTAIGVWAVLL